MTKIVFCIHGCAIKPIGGHKILYECANRLSDRGYDVTIVFPSFENLYQLKVPVFIRIWILKLLTDVFRVVPKWFKLQRKVHLKTVRDYNQRNFPDADYVMATAMETAEGVYKLPERCGKKLYLIQDFENWKYDDECVIRTYKYGMTNITISSWLKDKVQQYSLDKVYCIPNAIDTKIFKVKKPIAERNNHVIGLLYHSGKHKGLKYAFESLNIVKSKYSDLSVEIFGATRPDFELPSWFNFHYRLNTSELCDLYNNCSVFLCASVKEGFGLTGAESMACGCALVSTAYQGVFEYAIDRVNALLSPIEDSEGLANNILKLFANDKYRMKIAEQGSKDIKKRSWTNFMDEFEKILC